MKLLFVNLSSLKFDVATPEREPLGGTESCLCYLTRQLAKNGHDVTLITQLPPATPDVVLKVKHKPFNLLKDQGFFAAEKFDAIVVANAALACAPLRAFNPDIPIIFWDHIPPEQPAIRALGEPEVLRAIDRIIYVSAWQKTETEKFFKIDKKSCLIGNGLTPTFENMFSSPQELLTAKENRAAYTVIPYRGLPLLLSVMEQMQTETKLDVFSSMRVYQMADDEYKELYKRAAENPLATYHGSVSQTELAQRLRAAAFFTYPCILAETFCISVIEALAAGMKVIATDIGAIKTTALGFADLMPVKPGNGTREEFIAVYKSLLEKNIAEFKTRPEAWAEERFAQMQEVNRNCSWHVRAREWEQLLNACMRN